MGPRSEPANRGLCTCPAAGLLNSAQAAEHLGVSQRCIRAWVQERKIIFYKVGKFVRFRASDLDALIEAGRQDVWPR